MALGVAVSMWRYTGIMPLTPDEIFWVTADVHVPHQGGEDQCQYLHVAHGGGTPWEVTEHQQRHHQPAFAVTHDFTRH